MANKYGFNFQWINLYKLKSKDFQCFNCGKEISSQSGFSSISEHSYQTIYICHNCNAPNIFDHNNEQVIKPIPGKNILNLPKDIEEVYKEIRINIQSECYTSAIMMMRKILMHIAVENGAKKDKSFLEYVNYLDENHISHKKHKYIVNKIKDLGNDVNHKIEVRNKEKNKEIVEYIFLYLEHLLIDNYEYTQE